MVPVVRVCVYMCVYVRACVYMHITQPVANVLVHTNICPRSLSHTHTQVLMDTQGMFDFQTSKELTAAIFGLSTLISSVQIYNLSKQIQVCVGA
jgi:hypothetical protein